MSVVRLLATMVAALALAGPTAAPPPRPPPPRPPRGPAPASPRRPRRPQGPAPAGLSGQAVEGGLRRAARAGHDPGPGALQPDPLLQRPRGRAWPHRRVGRRLRAVREPEVQDRQSSA